MASVFLYLFIQIHKNISVNNTKMYTIQNYSCYDNKLIIEFKLCTYWNRSNNFKDDFI